MQGIISVIRIEKLFYILFRINHCKIVPRLDKKLIKELVFIIVVSISEWKSIG